MLYIAKETPYILFRKIKKRLWRIIAQEEIPKRISLAERRFGLPPGSIVNIGERESTHTNIQVITFSESSLEEKTVEKIDDAIIGRDSSKVTWINIEGYKDIATFERIGELLDIDKLVLEDILDLDTRPKFEEFENYAFASVKMLYLEADTSLIFHEQVSFILTGNLLITFQFEYGDVFEKVRERIRKTGGRIRFRKADYLMYALLDIIVDHYFIALERYDERVRSLEDEVLEDPERSFIPQIRQLRKDNIMLRKAASPLRESVGLMLRSDTKIFEQSTKKYLRELSEHLVQANEAIEMSRELTTGLMEIYLSALNTKMGNVNKALTVIATIFLPLTFITGVYGMNFSVLPGADKAQGFWYVMAFMGSLSVGMLIYFRYKKWF